MAGDEFQKQLDLASVLDDAKYGRVYLIQESQGMHAQEAVKLNGHFALSDGLKAVFLDSLDLLNIYCRPFVASLY